MFQRKLNPPLSFSSVFLLKSQQVKTNILTALKKPPIQARRSTGCLTSIVPAVSRVPILQIATEMGVSISPIAT